MLKAIAWKEVREALPLIVVALLIQVYLVTSATGSQWGQLASWGTEFVTEAGPESRLIPFVDSLFNNWFSAARLLCFVTAACGMGLGLWQTMRESSQGTYLFLLHRPLAREAIIGTKLFVGAGVCFLVGALPLAYYTLWAATPGTHASPFAWWMPASSWAFCVEAPLLYFAAFLSGLRPGRWFGSRFLPLAAGIALLMVLRYLPMLMFSSSPWAFVAVVTGLVLDALFVLVILHVARTRDFS